jgi:hypothetical protein
VAKSLPTNGIVHLLCQSRLLCVRLQKLAILVTYEHAYLQETSPFLIILYKQACRCLWYSRRSALQKWHSCLGTLTQVVKHQASNSSHATLLVEVTHTGALQCNCPQPKKGTGPHQVSHPSQAAWPSLPRLHSTGAAMLALHHSCTIAAAPGSCCMLPARPAADAAKQLPVSS